jgi:hypothetical protein
VSGVDERDDAADPRRNPYAPPAALEPGARDGARGWPYGYVVGYVVLEALALANDGARYLELTKVDGGLIIYLVASLVGLGWLGARWEGLPARLRVVAESPVSGSAVVWRHFIPIYGLVWLFRVQAALCDAIDRRLGAYQERARAPRGLATAACTSFLFGRFSGVLGLPLYIAVHVASGLLWAVYMVEIEKTYRIAFAPRD